MMGAPRLANDDDSDLGDFTDPPGGLINGVNCLMSPRFVRSWWEVNGAPPETLARLMDMLD